MMNVVINCVALPAGKELGKVIAKQAIGAAVGVVFGVGAKVATHFISKKTINVIELNRQRTKEDMMNGTYELKEA